MRAFLVIALVACSAAPAPVAEPADDDKSDVFSDRGDFKPKSFGVDIKGEGRPVILIAGLGCPGEVWDDTVAHLSASYQTHVLTLAGFAGQPRIHKPLSATVRRELIRYIRSRKLDKPIIVGHSMGGFIAYWLAATAPELLGGVIVVDAGPALSDTDVETARTLRKLWTQAEDAEFTQQVHDAYIGMGADSKRMDKVIAEVDRSDRMAMGDAIYEMTVTDLRAKMSNIKAPVLLVLADGSFVQHYRDLVANIPRIDIHVLPHTHHFVMFDDPKGFFGLVDTFLGNRSGGKSSL